MAIKFRWSLRTMLLFFAGVCIAFAMLRRNNANEVAISQWVSICGILRMNEISVTNTFANRMYGRKGRFVLVGMPGLYPAVRVGEKPFDSMSGLRLSADGIETNRGVVKRWKELSSTHAFLYYRNTNGDFVLGELNVTPELKKAILSGERIAESSHIKSIEIAVREFFRNSDIDWSWHAPDPIGRSAYHHYFGLEQ